MVGKLEPTACRRPEGSFPKLECAEFCVCVLIFSKKCAELCGIHGKCWKAAGCICAERCAGPVWDTQRGVWDRLARETSGEQTLRTKPDKSSPDDTKKRPASK